MTPSEAPLLRLLSGFDPEVWIAWRPGDGADWAREQAALCFSDVAGPSSDEQVDGLARQLEVVARELQALGVVLNGFVHLPDPVAGVSFVVTVKLLEAGDGSEESLVALTLGEEQGLAEPSVAPFEGTLGVGVRVQRHVEVEGTVVDTLAYVWPRPDLGTDVLVSTSSVFLGVLLDAEDQVEELVRDLDLEVVDPTS